MLVRLIAFTLLAFAFTADCHAEACQNWKSAEGDWLSALKSTSCLHLPKGTFLLDKPIYINATKHLLGSGPDTIIKADAKTWVDKGEGLIVTVGVNALVTDLTLDASGVASYDIGGSRFTVERADLRNGRAGAVGIAGPGVVISQSKLHHIGQPTLVPGRGLFDCEYVASRRVGLPLCTAIYAQGGREGTGTRDYAPEIKDCEIFDVIGPGIDMNRVNKGLVENTSIRAQTGWTAFNLYGSSGWRVRRVHISIRHDASGTQLHTKLNRTRFAPALMISSDDPTLPANNNDIENSFFDGFVGIALLGVPADGVYPRGNILQNNIFQGSNIPCISDQHEGDTNTQCPSVR